MLDNTVLTNFALVGRADLLLCLWPHAASTTQAALAEYRAGVTGGLLPADIWASLPIIPLDDDENAFAAGLSQRLGTGERACLAVALHRHGLLATDDQDARRAARACGVPVTGTLGILVQSIRRGPLTRSQGNALLAEMIAAGYYAPVDQLDPLLGE